MRNLDSLLVEYCEHLVNVMDRSGFSGINIIEKILKDPGISTLGSKHRVLWWPKNKRIAKMSRAFHYVIPMARVCLVVEYGRALKEDGWILTKKEFCADAELSCALFDSYVKVAKKQLRYILKTYKKRPKNNYCID